MASQTDPLTGPQQSSYAVDGAPVFSASAVVHHGDATGDVDVVVVVVGSLCAASCGTLGELLDTLVADGMRNVRIDLSALTLCTSDGVDVIEAHRRDLEERGGSLTLVGSRGVVRRVLDLLEVGGEAPTEHPGP